MKHNRWLLPALFLSGAAGLIHEVAWLRPLGVVYLSTVYLVAIITTSFMAGLACGSFFMGVVLPADRLKRPLLVYGWLEFSLGLYGLLLLEAFNLLAHFNHILVQTGNPFTYHLVLFGSVFLLLVVPTSLMGATFPLLARAYIGEQTGKGLGEIYAFNNLGAIVGSLAAGFLLVPSLGVRATIIIAAGLNVTAGMLVILSEFGWRHVRSCALLGSAFVALASVSSYSIDHLYRRGLYGAFKIDYLGDRQIVFEQEGRHATVAVMTDAGNPPVPRLLIDGEGSSSLRPTDVRVSVLLGFLPRWLRPELSNAAVIGYGVGGAARMLANEIETTTIELEPAVVAASPFFAPLNRDVLNDPRHRVVYADARNFLLRTPKRFDIVVNHPLDFNRSCSSLLFTREFFELVRDRLTPNGLYVQWIPLYSMSREDFSDLYHTLASVFPYQIAFANAYPSGEPIVICSMTPLDRDQTLLRTRFDSRSAADRSLLDYSRLHAAEDLFRLLLFTEADMASYREDARFLTDDHPRLEFVTVNNRIRYGNGAGQEIVRELATLRLNSGRWD